MTLRVVGAGLPRTGTASLGTALERLLGGLYYHMSVIPGHPFDLGEAWDSALYGGSLDWDAVFEGYVAALDWPASMFWKPISEKYPDALILLSVRDSAETWLASAEATFMPFARMSLAPEWPHGRGLSNLLGRFAGTHHWNDPATLLAAYDRHVESVRREAPADRLLEWRATEGWVPICERLGLPVPDAPFPWTNRREDWG